MYDQHHYEAQVIFLEKKNKVLIAPQCEEVKLSVPVLGTILKNLESYGFTLSVDALKILQTYVDDQAIEFYEEILPTLKRMTGAHKKFKPMYPNFPKQVMEAPAAELYINAIMHYLGDWLGVRIMPLYDVEIRPELIENTKLTVIDVGTYGDLHNMLKDIMRSKTSISTSDVAYLSWYIKSYKSMVQFPEKFNHKEVLATTVGLILEHTNLTYDIISRYFKTATDVLRLAMFLSGGDVSLAENDKFRNFNRKERRFLLGLLDECGSIGDMKRHKNKWLRLGEKLHPGDYSKKFNKAFMLFSTLRNSKNISNFNTWVEQALEKHDTLTASKLLKDRPGMFARRLDHLLRLAPTTNKATRVINRFKEVATSVSVPVLLQVASHFKTRKHHNDLRIFFPKGQVSKIRAIENELPELSNALCDKVVDICEGAIKIHFSGHEEMGNVYLDERLHDYLVPFSQRSASKAFKTLVRGSKIYLPDGDTVRFFIWWKNKGGERVDLDLSGMIYNHNWEYLEHISYTNLRSRKYNSCHSGDITSAPNGACEFIDIDMKTLRKYGGRYITMNVLSYTEQPFSDLPECFAGWMIRHHVQSGEIFEAKTVQNKIDITTNSKIVMPLVIDVVKKKVIWADMGVAHNRKSCNNIEGNYDSISLVGKALTEVVKPNLYDLFRLHVEARNGRLVDTSEKADIVFSLDEGITPFDVEVISSQYL